MTLLLIAMMALATYRLTRLVVEDTFPPAKHLRDRITGWAYAQTPMIHKASGIISYWVPTRPRLHWIGDLITCHWCASVWVGAGVTAATWPFADLSWPLLVWATVASVGAFLNQFDGILQKTYGVLEQHAPDDEE